MKDAIEARLWADHHEGFADGIDAVAAGIRDAFASLPTVARALLIVLAVSLANLGLTEPALAQNGAQTAAQTRQITVRYSPTDIVTPEGAARLDARLRSSATRLCRTHQVGFGENTARRDCYDTALGQARRQVEAAQIRVAASLNTVAGSR